MEKMRSKRLESQRKKGKANKFHYFIGTLFLNHVECVPTM